VREPVRVAPADANGIQRRGVAAQDDIPRTAGENVEAAVWGGEPYGGINPDEMGEHVRGQPQDGVIGAARDHGDAHRCGRHFHRLEVQ